MMVKIFQGNHLAVERDFNNWIDVYKPIVVDMKQSVVLMQKEHDVVLVLTVLYEVKTESKTVEYNIYKE